MAKFPKTLGACVDLAYEQRSKRIEQQREFDAQIEELKASEKEIFDHILRTFKKSDIEGAKGKTATAAVVRTTVPSVTDWPKVFAYIEAHDAWDLMERRMARVAYRDRLQNKEVIPGVEPFEKVDLSLTKLPNKEA